MFGVTLVVVHGLSSPAFSLNMKACTKLPSNAAPPFNVGMLICEQRSEHLALVHTRISVFFSLCLCVLPVDTAEIRLGVHV